MASSQTYLNPFLIYTYPLNTTKGINIPVLNKIAVDSANNSLYAAYSNGSILRYNTETHSCANIFSIYENTDVIDIEIMNANTLLTCSHNQLTVYDLVKNKSLSLKGHQQTPIAVSSHPISPLVVSVSNLLVQHDLRIKKPINVNFITPPVYDVEYFADGSYYFLSGQPCRVGRQAWVRTLLNGIGTVSQNSKYVAVNQMNGELVVWDWRKSERVLTIGNVENEENYQSIFFRKEKGEIRGVLFLEDNGCLLSHDILNGQTSRKWMKEEMKEEENWKISVDSLETTNLVYTYEHFSAQINCYKVQNFDI